MLELSRPRPVLQVFYTALGGGHVVVCYQWEASVVLADLALSTARVSLSPSRFPTERPIGISEPL